MGVKLEKILELPSLREAKIVSGRNELQKTVTSLSFLEVSDMLFFNNNIQVPNEYYAGELTISSFFSIRDDVAKQCEAIRRLHALGEIGIILYYVGIVLKDLSQEVIDVAEELGFVIIKMPENDYSLRYNEAIIEIMAKILQEKSNENIVNEVLEKTTLLPDHLRNVEISLKILSDLLRSNVILTNEVGEVINQVKWPRNLKADLLEFLINDHHTILTKRGKYWFYHKEIYHKDNGVLNFYLIRELEPLTSSICEQSVELVQVVLNLWGEKHGEVSEYGLVKAILNDESDKMYRLAKILSINVKNINLMWLIQLKSDNEAENLKSEILDFVTKYYHISIVQLIDNQLVVLLGNYKYHEAELSLSNQYLKEGRFYEEIESLVVCPRLKNTTDVRKNYQLVEEVKQELSTLFDEKKIFTISEIRQVQYALNYIQSGEKEVERILAILEPISKNKEQLSTLCTLLLDFNGDFQKCADHLFLHKNTVKYRVKKISELLGCDVTKISNSYEYSIACMVYRMIRQ